MITISNQSSVPMAYGKFDEAGRMKAGPLYDRVVDVCEELMKFTLLTRAQADYLVDRYSERREREPDRLAAVAADIGFKRRWDARVAGRFSDRGRVRTGWQSGFGLPA